MIYVLYEIRCRSCFKTDGVKHIYDIKDGNEADLKKKTEYQMMNLIEDWRREDGHVCQGCKSTNVEVLNVKIDDFPLYDFDRLVKECINKSHEMVIVGVTKIEKRLDIEVRGSRSPEINFTIDCYKKMNSIILSISDKMFVPHQKGDFFICFTGAYDLQDFDNNKTKNKLILQKFRFIGISQEELLSGLKEQIERLGISNLVFNE